MNVGLSRFYLLTFVLGGFCTCGLVPLILWFQARSFPRYIDVQGVRLRNGKFYPWSQLKKATPVTVIEQRGRRVAGKLLLEFDLDNHKLKKVNIVPASYQEGYAVIDYINSILGTELKSG